jgi:hypothetical protein
MWNNKTQSPLRVGFITPRIRPYYWTMASTRIRVYDVIRALRKTTTLRVGLYMPFRRYDIVVFQKVFSEQAYTQACSLKDSGTRIVLDINVNYYDVVSKKILPSQRDAIIRFTHICDAVIASTHHIAKEVKALFPHIRVVVIEESIHEKYFSRKKDIQNTRQEITLIWSGYCAKAKELTLLRDVCEEVFRERPFRICIISDKDPCIDMGSVPVSFQRYRERDITSLLLQGDVFIAPRDLNESYNHGHSFTKIGVAMALGLPVCASPIPSYEGSPALLLHTKEEWRECLSEIMVGGKCMQEIADKGVQYCKERCGMEHIAAQYLAFFRTL